MGHKLGFPHRVYNTPDEEIRISGNFAGRNQ
jgi:hypothetical protein